MTFKKDWWKILGVALILYTIIAGFLIPVPDLRVIGESIRNLFFHVCMWFAMMTIFGVSLVYSIRYLSGFDIRHDVVASQAVNVGLLFGILGIVTGMQWANYTWGAPWVNDPQLNGAAVSILAYFAYTVLRHSMDEDHKRAKVAAVYNIFAFVLLIIFVGILPKMSHGSLHPGAGGSPSTMATLDNTMRMVFYPAIVGWILIGTWILNIRVRYVRLKQQADMNE
ncbi:MAG TPA: cytochrome c biogenesis protein CcsA [Bacteroidales bacterium]